MDIKQSEWIYKITIVLNIILSTLSFQPTRPGFWTEGIIGKIQDLGALSCTKPCSYAYPSCHQFKALQVSSKGYWKERERPFRIQPLIRRSTYGTLYVKLLNIVSNWRSIHFAGPFCIQASDRTNINEDWKH